MIVNDAIKWLSVKRFTLRKDNSKNKMLSKSQLIDRNRMDFNVSNKI